MCVCLRVCAHDICVEQSVCACECVDSSDGQIEGRPKKREREREKERHPQNR